MSQSNTSKLIPARSGASNSRRGKFTSISISFFTAALLITLSLLTAVPAVAQVGEDQTERAFFHHLPGSSSPLLDSIETSN